MQQIKEMIHAYMRYNLGDLKQKLNQRSPYWTYEKINELMKKTEKPKNSMFWNIQKKKKVLIAILIGYK